MKNITKKLLLCALTLSTINFISCDDKDDATGASTLEVVSGVQGSVSLVAPLAATQTVKEGDEGTYEYTITLNKPQSIDIHVKVAQISGTADDHDYEFTNEIVIPAYSTSAKGSIHILNDVEEESTEDLTLQIGLPSTSNASFTSSTISFTIKDCYSDLAGTYTYVTTNCFTPGPPAANAAGPFTGSVTFTATANPGVYDISDASFGGWLGLYGPQANPVNETANGVKLNHLCGVLSYSGVDQFGEVFTFSNLVVLGSTMSFHWENDYGEYGDTTLTRTDGTNWPDLSL